MSQTYITRRIDELGRFVIPKEIRRNLKIKNNDQLEIKVVDNEIILNKYENSTKDKNISILLKNLRKYLNKNILYTSRDTIIDYSLINKGVIDSNMLTDEIIGLIEKRKISINNSPFYMDVNNSSSYLISPLIINGDIFGSIIVYGENEICSKDIEIITFINMFLENYLE